MNIKDKRTKKKLKRKVIVDKKNEDSIWLAEKVGLFNDCDSFVIIPLKRVEAFRNGVDVVEFRADTIPETICRAVISIYGRK